MSTESLDSQTDSPKNTPLTEKKSRPPIPDILRHQHSFEQRYSSIIHKNIWENSINKDVLERQLNAYFPFARSASLQKETGQSGFDALEAIKKMKKTTFSEKPEISRRDKDKCLERLAAMDITDNTEATSGTQASAAK